VNVAVQMDPIERINIRGDSTFALLLEAQAAGTAELLHAGPAGAVQGRVFATCSR
jgi:glutathione synthase